MGTKYKYIGKIFLIQKNDVRIISFAEFNAHTDPILKIKDHISLQNCLFAYNFINKNLPKSFNNNFSELKDIHSIETRISNAGNLFIPYSIYRKSIDAWNHFKKQLKDKNLSGLPRYKLKKLITEQILLTYI